MANFAHHSAEQVSHQHDKTQCKKRSEQEQVLWQLYQDMPPKRRSKHMPPARPLRSPRSLGLAASWRFCWARLAAARGTSSPLPWGLRCAPRARGAGARPGRPGPPGSRAWRARARPRRTTPPRRSDGIWAAAAARGRPGGESQAPCLEVKHQCCGFGAWWLIVPAVKSDVGSSFTGSGFGPALDMFLTLNLW